MDRRTLSVPGSARRGQVLGRGLEICWGPRCSGRQEVGNPVWTHCLELNTEPPFWLLTSPKPASPLQPGPQDQLEHYQDDAIERIRVGSKGAQRLLVSESLGLTPMKTQIAEI
eukprot:bmy_08333T0